MTTTPGSIGQRFNIERLLVLPWLWLKRTRGWRRRGLLLLYLFVATGAALLGWRLVCLSGLPDVGDPFDVAALESYQVPDAENAFVLYQKALDRLETDSQPQGSSRLAVISRRGSNALDPAVRAWVLANYDALDLWRQGTERPKALPGSLKTVTLYDEPRLYARLDTFVSLALA
jgi:hypothetical protein